MIDIAKIQKEKPIEELIKFSIINIDKPLGPTCFSIDSYIRRALNLNKTSHFGTLDPIIVSGVLPIALGRACRLNEYFMHRNKVYVGIMQLHKEVSDDVLNSVVKKYIGKIMQLPPVRSRVKRAVREREIVSFNILERKGKSVLFETEVQAGTYIRKLLHDMGQEAEIGGAHMLELRRTKAGLFEEGKDFPLTTLYDFDKAVEAYKNGNEELLREILIPGEVVSRLLPVVNVNPNSLKKILTGKPLFDNDIKGYLPEQERFALFNKNILLGIYRISKEGDIIARPEFVLN